MIDGAVEWLRDGLKQPSSVRAATARYFAEQDLTSRWLEEACTFTPANASRWETGADLFKSWSDFAKANGEEPGSAKNLAARLRRHGLRDGVRWANGRTVRAWEGVEILRASGGDQHG
jgi:putative DNA primase/helicase